MNARLYLLMLMVAALAVAGCNRPDGTVENTPAPSLTPMPTLTPTLSPTVPPNLPPTGSPTPTAIAVQPVTAPAPQTPGAYPAQSSVLMAEGRCCVGGQVGSQTEVTVSFHPSFPASEMRYRDAGACLTEAELAQTPWQPFAAAVTLPVPISTVNWIGLYVSAQYRDAQGHLSSVVCDDISVEGMPAGGPAQTP